MQGLDFGFGGSGATTKPAELQVHDLEGPKPYTLKKPLWALKASPGNLGVQATPKTLNTLKALNPNFRRLIRPFQTIP